MRARVISCHAASTSRTCAIAWCSGTFPCLSPYGEQAAAQVHRLSQKMISDILTLHLLGSFNDPQEMNSLQKAIPGLVDMLSDDIFTTSKRWRWSWRSETSLNTTISCIKPVLAIIQSDYHPIIIGSLYNHWIGGFKRWQSDYNPIISSPRGVEVCAQA